MVTLPYDDTSATVGNGVMVAVAVKNRGVVDAVHRKAVELGAADEGCRARVVRAASMLASAPPPKLTKGTVLVGRRRSREMECGAHD